MTDQSCSVAEIKKGIDFKAWVLATRPQTLPIALGPILVGAAMAYPQVEKMDWVLVILTLVCALFIQIGMNLVNDALDYKKGEGQREKLDLQRMGLLSVNQFYLGGCFSFFLALLFGIPLMFAGGWPLVIILLLSVASGYCYTGGPYPLAYIGISNLFILVFYGWVSTAAVYYLQTGTVTLGVLLAGTQMGLLSIVPHAINNLRDHVADAAVNKRTLSVRFGSRFGRWEITCLSLIPFVIGMFWFIEENAWMALLPSLVLPSVIGNIQGIWKHEPSRLFNKNLTKSALCQLAFGCLLALGALFG